MKTETPFISCIIGSEDFDLFKSIVNQSIDSHLEAFTKSRFDRNPKLSSRFDFFFHETEIPLLMRRLSEIAEMGNEDAEQWENDILDVEYGIEIV